MDRKPSEQHGTEEQGVANDTAEHAASAPVRDLSSPARTEHRRGFMSASPAELASPSRGVALGRDALYRRSLVFADAVAAVLAMYTAVTLLGKFDSLRLTSLLAAPIAVLTSKVIGLYDRDELVLRKSTLEEAPALFQLATLYALLVSVLSPLLIHGSLGHKQVLGLWGTLFLFSLLGRVSARALVGAMVSPERCLVIGDGEDANTVERKLRDGSGFNACVVMQIQMELDADHAAELQLLRTAVAEHDIHRVVFAARTADSDAVLDAIRTLNGMGVGVSLLPRMFEAVGSSVVFDDLHGVTVLGVRRFGLSRSSLAVKRAVDAVGAGVGLIAMAPLMALIALAVKLDSRGPIFFRQIRVGRDDRHFEMLKFRTMVE
jgi:hypothetical protein